MIQHISQTKTSPAAGFASEEDRAAIIERAFNYRGDVTLLLRDNRRLSGYVSNRDISCRQGDVSPAWIEILLPDVDSPRRLNVADIHSIEFTGKDAAEGKTWDAWLVKVAKAEADGKIAELYPDE